MTIRRPPPVLIGPPKIQNGRFDQLVRKLFGIKQDGVVSHVDPAAQSSVDLLLGRYADQFLAAGVVPWTVSVRATAVAGERQIWHLVNPAGSNQIAIIDAAAIIYGGMGAHSPVWYITDYASLSNPVPVVFRDGRSWVNTGKAAIPQNGLRLVFTSVLSATNYPTFIGGGSSFFTLRERANMVATHTDPRDDLGAAIVLPPGTSLGIDTTSANASVSVQMSGTVRAIEPYEVGLR